MREQNRVARIEKRGILRAVIQRVNSSRVLVKGRTLDEIGQGLLVLLGVCDGDDQKDVDYVADKIAALRIFGDKTDKLNLSVQDVAGEVLVVSQFTLLGDCRKGRRPSFAKAANPEQALLLYQQVIKKLRSIGISVKQGQFQAKMSLEIVNDGPVTVLLDSTRAF